MLKLNFLSALYIFDLYIAFLIIYLRHRHYFQSLFGKAKEVQYNNTTFSMHRSLWARVAPMYRREYFGYEGFVLPELNNKILHPHHRLRVYGLVKPYSECLLLYKGDTVKTVIALDDKRYGDTVLEDFRKIYKWIIIVTSGGAILWQISLWFSIF